jgi:uncharacterized protein YegP (UPF0339 family)
MKAANVAERSRAADRRREPAAAHFRRLDKSEPAPAVTMPGCTFEVYRADEVRMTSTQFGGGDWHWRLADADGLIMLDTGGYASEGECLDAVAILRDNAGFASLTQPSRT